MKHKTAKPIYLDENEIIKLSKNIINLDKDLIFNHILEIYKIYFKKNLKLNSISELEEAFKKNIIYFEDGKIKGIFNSKIVKELKKLEAVYNRKFNYFEIEPEDIPGEIYNLVYESERKAKNFAYDLDDFLNEVKNNIEFSVDRENLSFNDTLINYQKQLKENLNDYAIIPDLNEYEVKSINKEYTNNLKRYIKNWEYHNIEKLRNQIKDFVLNKGYSNKKIAELIQKNFETSQNKAVFLARQESSLLLASFSKNKYKKLGLNEYQWETSNDEKVRESHKELNGKIFNFDNPPIVNKTTGERANPGEQFNCRCLPLPII